MGVEITPLSIDDYAAAMAIWTAAEGIGLSDADSRDAIRRYLDRNPGMSLVARDDGRVVGAALCGHDGRRGYLHHLAVAESHRRKGIGSALVDGCLSALRAAGIRKCHLFLRTANTSGEAFWQSVGWTLRKELKVASRNL